MCQILDKNFENINKHRKILENEYDSQFEGYGVVKQEDRTNHINNKLCNVTIHQKIKKIDLKEIGMDYDATSLYPSAIWDEKSVYPKKKSGSAFEPLLHDVNIESFKIQTFNQDSNETAISKTEIYLLKSWKR